MGYHGCMGYLPGFFAYQVGNLKNIWVKREYGLSELWVKRASTVQLLDFEGELYALHSNLN